MKRMSSFLCLALCAVVLSGAGETRVERLADDIWRVRVSRDGTWSESPMNPLSSSAEGVTWE